MSFGVHRGDWGRLGPEFAVLVAPAISVSSMRVAPRAVDAVRQAQQERSRGNMPVERHRRANR